MTNYVIKRDGKVVEFCQARIFSAIEQAMLSVQQFEHSLCTKVCASAVAKFAQSEHIDIETIQDCVESTLMQFELTEVARSFIRYRQRRDMKREARSALYQQIDDLFAQRNGDLLHENANKDSKVIPTQRDLLAGLVARHYAKNHLLPSDVVEAHDQGLIHYHDLDYAPLFPMFNCMIVDLKNMLTQGFNMGNAHIETPKSIQTAASVTAQIIAQVASHIYGGTTIDRIDQVLAPYVEASYLKHVLIGQQWQIANVEAYALTQTEKECYDAFQALEYEVNTLHTANGQTPFVTFGFGLGTDRWSRMIQQAILRVRLEGLGSTQKTAIFPKLVFSLKRGVNLNPEDINYDLKQLALSCAVHRMYPDILNVEQLEATTGSFKAPMGCRSFLGPYSEDGHLVHAGRNNLGVVSINLPRLALGAQKNLDHFWHSLDQTLALCFRALMTRVERLRHVKAHVAPILYMEGACGWRLQADESVFQLFDQGRASISLGYIGLHEAILALTGSESDLYDSAEKQALAIKVVKHLRKATDQWKDQTGLGFSLYATPSENLCYRFCRKDQKDFGTIEAVTDKGYYTNSFHLDVEKVVSPYEKIQFELPYPEISNGGFICYGEFPNMKHNIKALEDVWDYSYDRVPYYGTNTPIDACYVCGFTGEFKTSSSGFYCPQCENKEAALMSVTRRVCGYLGTPNARPFNPGKQQEVKRRQKHWRRQLNALR